MREVHDNGSLSEWALNQPDLTVSIPPGKSRQDYQDPVDISKNIEAKDCAADVT
jgi:hypothetical protein